MAKILFVVDTSGSNASSGATIIINGVVQGSGTDPNNIYRLGSINTFFNQYSSKTNFYWGLITFNTAIVDYVKQVGSASSFTGTKNVMQNAITAYSNGETANSGTMYTFALNAAKQAIINDPDNTSVNRAKGLKYYVILMSDGAPSDLGNPPDPANATPYVSALLAAAPNAVTLDTVLYGNQNADPAPVQMLSGIATEGNGIFTNSTNLNTININNLVQQNVCP